MSDTVRIKRPIFPRRPGGPGGRVEHDSRGNAVWVRTRSTDTPEPPDTSGLAIVDEPEVPEKPLPTERRRR